MDLPKTLTLSSRRPIPWKGYTMVIAAAILWALSGTVAQILFQQRGISPGWMVSVRLLGSGILLLLIASLQKEPQRIWAIWKEKKELGSLLLYGLVAMPGVQYTFFATIKASNIATATLLQYLAPVLVFLYVVLSRRKFPGFIQIFAVVLALIGTFLLITNGSLDKLIISSEAVFWGLTSALAFAFYTLQPLRLLKRWGSTLTMGWGMLIGGVELSFFYPPWQIQGQLWSWNTAFLVVFVVTPGTLIAFYLFMESLRYNSPTESSLLAIIEPLTATFVSVVWLQVPFGFYEIIGGVCILGTVTLLTLQKE